MEETTTSPRGDTTTITDSIGTDETTDETTTEEETTTDEETDTDLGDFASGDCEELVNASSAIGEALSGANTPDEVEAASERFQQFADEVPEEIQDDVQVLADVYDKYIAVIADIDLEAGRDPLGRADPAADGGSRDDRPAGRHRGVHEPLDLGDRRTADPAKLTARPAARRHPRGRPSEGPNTFCP